MCLWASNMKKYEEKNIFCILEEERSRIQSWIRGSGTGSGSAPKCHGSPTLAWSLQHWREGRSLYIADLSLTLVSIFQGSGECSAGVPGGGDPGQESGGEICNPACLASARQVVNRSFILIFSFQNSNMNIEQWRHMSYLHSFVTI